MFEQDPLPKRVAKYSILLSIKESYLLVRNWIGMFLHPFKTIRALLREKDYSQIFLVFAFPFYMLVIGLGTIWAARRVVGITPGHWGWPTKTGVTILTIFAGYLLIHLGFWLFQVFKVKKN